MNNEKIVIEGTISPLGNIVIEEPVNVYDKHGLLRQTKRPSLNDLFDLVEAYNRDFGFEKQCDRVRITIEKL